MMRISTLELNAYINGTDKKTMKSMLNHEQQIENNLSWLKDFETILQGICECETFKQIEEKLCNADIRETCGWASNVMQLLIEKQKGECNSMKLYKQDIDKLLQKGYITLSLFDLSYSGGYDYLVNKANVELISRNGYTYLYMDGNEITYFFKSLDEIKNILKMGE